jgi:hypothetical protein
VKNYKNIVTIVDSTVDQPYSSQFVYDEHDKSIRLDIDNKIAYEHIKLNRKQAVKLLKLLEEFILHNP